MRALIWVESLVVAEIAATKRSAWRTLAVAVFSQGVVIGHGLAGWEAEAVSRQA